MTAPRVRFAPSPTGYLHVGGARTALFNWLFARNQGGVFVLRIEDTDAERSSADMVEGILDGLRWLGLDWDEGPKIDGPYAPYFQSERIERYRTMAERLVAGGRAYYCYCTPEELKAKRAAAELADGGWKYDRTCAALTNKEIAAREQAKAPRAVRVRVPEGTVRFDDIVHGAIEVDGATIEDFVILRSDGQPTYHLSVVADDAEMAITHVVRGDDHISNTPKQILLYQAIGAPLPRFAHVPLILGPDRKRLSKRHGATSVMEYARQGYVPEALVNFLALLGWSPGRQVGQVGQVGQAGQVGQVGQVGREGRERQEGLEGREGIGKRAQESEREIFSRDELVSMFALEGIGGGNAVFNPEKLDWFNQQHMARLAPDELARRLKPLFEAGQLWTDSYLGDRHAWFFAVLELLKPRARRLQDFLTHGRFFFTDAIEYHAAAVDKHLRVDSMTEHLLALDAALAALPAFDVTSIEGALRSTAEARGVKAATLIHAVRVALTGTPVSPGLFEVVALVGRQRTHERLRAVPRLISLPKA